MNNLFDAGYVSECEKSSPVNYFWYRETLNITANIETSGSVQWWLVLCLASAWCLVYICFIRGIETIGKVTYLFDVMPQMIFIIISICCIPQPIYKQLMAKYWHLYSNTELKDT